MIHNPHVAGTFWETTDGRRWLVGPAERWISMDPATLGNIRQLTPNLTGAVQLHLAPLLDEPEPPGPLDCLEDTSCAPGDHTYTWPCSFAAMGPAPIEPDREPRPLGWLFRQRGGATRG